MTMGAVWAVEALHQVVRNLDMVKEILGQMLVLNGHHRQDVLLHLQLGPSAMPTMQKQTHQRDRQAKKEQKLDRKCMKDGNG
jgi:hypothetical protein